jgi:hypothetical protein
MASNVRNVWLSSFPATREADQASNFICILIIEGETPKQREIKPAKQDSEAHGLTAETWA